MYNSILSVKIESVAPYSTERKGKENEGINVGASLQVKNANVFDDIDFGKNKNGLQTILKGELPIKGSGVRLNFIKKKDTTFDISGSGPGLKNIPVAIDDIFTGAMKNGVITLKLKLNVKQLDEEIAGLLSSRLNDFLDIKIKSSQMDIAEQTPVAKNDAKSDGKKIIPMKTALATEMEPKPEKKKRTSGKTTLPINK